MAFTGALDEVLRRVDIVDLARKLGVSVGRRESNHTRALCPFHADKDPSLALYQDAGNPHYHCFSCGAHGGALDFVAAQRRVPKDEALRWLANEVGVELPRGTRKDNVGTAGRVAFKEWLERHQSKDLLELFAEQRALDATVLSEAGALAVDMSALNVGSLAPGEREALEEAGVLGRRRGILVPIAGQNQIVFPLDRERGFIFRALDNGASDKTSRYRFSKGLRKSEVLFGAALVEERVRSGAVLPGVFVVEGIMDVLRLRSLGLPAVGILGTSISRNQAEQIKKICGPEERPVVPVHLFLDADDAGRRAAPAAIRALLGIESPTPVDVISPDQEGDPDDLLKALEPKDALKQLGDWTYSVLAALAQAYTGSPIYSALNELATARPLMRVEALRYVNAQFRGRWPRLRDSADPSATYLGEAHRDDESWLRDSLDRAAGLQVLDSGKSPKSYRPSEGIPDQPDSYLRQALRLAQSSNFRREYPFDWGGMTRLALAANASIHVGRALLGDSQRRPIPYAARIVPKDDGRTRIKAGPWPEDSLIQQYVLAELLRARPDAPGWYMEFPAVRLIRSANPGPIFTGPPSLRPIGPSGELAPVVSFAYQIDQEILEGETPPRREGMFVPYRECWQQFVDHLDDFVARQPLDTDTFFAVRLDISGFFDNLPRYAVENVLRPAIMDGAERHFSGRDFQEEVAPLLKAEHLVSGEAGHRSRGEFVANWLINQTFDFRYFDPSSGEIRNAPSSTVGIPQGPDLSAYLANLSLFPLDREVTRIIEDNRISQETGSSAESKANAVYGRYVDDMVIVSTSDTLLSQLEGVIGEQLRRLGLAMNAKHERTRALSRRRVREWLLGERGAAVLVSAGGEETPTTNRTRVEDLLQVGPETTRSQVLQLLHHNDLYAPFWASDLASVQRVERTLKRLRALPSIDLRYYDWVSAARWCFHSFVLRQPNIGAESFASQFVAWWRDIYGKDVAEEAFGESADDRRIRQEQLELAPLLMSFDALERSIDSRYDRRGGTEPDIRDALRSSRESLAKMIRDEDLCAALLYSAKKADEAVASALPRVDAMLRIQSLAIRGLATGAAAGVAPLPRAGHRPSYAERRFILNALGTRIGEYATPVMQEASHLAAANWSPDAEPLLGLHEAIARLIGTAPKAGDPLTVMADPIRKWLDLLSAVAPTPAAADLVASLSILSLSNQFMEDPDEEVPVGERTTALRAFVEIVSGAQDGHVLMSARPHLVAALAGENFDPIAVPPGVDSSGFFAFHGQQLQAYAFVNGEQPAPPDEVVFGTHATADANSSERLVKYNCEIPVGYQIAKPRPPRLVPNSVTPADLAAFARAYRELVSAQLEMLQEEEGNRDRRPLTPLHLLEPVEKNASWRPFGAITRLPIGPQTFLRLGERRLHSAAVRFNGAYLWQVGFTVADHLGYRGFARSSELDRLTVGTLESDDTIEAIPFYVMQVTVPRLCGAYIGRTRFQLKPEHGIPGVLERQLTRLEAFSHDSANPVVHLGYLLEAGAEARAAELLSDTPAPLQVAGALISVFRSIGRAAARPERIFCKTLPPPKAGALTHRRTVDLWLAAASRLESLSEHNSLGIKTAAAAMRVQAVSRLAQSLTLEVWSLLRDDDTRLLDGFAPDPRELELPEEVLLVGGNQMQRSPVAGDQAVRLLGALTQHATPGATARSSLDQITPLGWIVALATLTGLLDIEPLPSAGPNPQRPELLAARNSPRASTGQSAERELSDILIEVGRFFASSVEDGWSESGHEADWPWSPFATIVEQTVHITSRMVRAARLVEGLYGLRARTRSGRLFQIAEADDQGLCLVFRDGDRQSITGWQIDRDSLGITRPGDLETRNEQGTQAYVWSETMRGNRLVSLSVGYRTLAEFAGTLSEPGDKGTLDECPAEVVEHSSGGTAEPTAGTAVTPESSAASQPVLVSAPSAAPPALPTRDALQALTSIWHEYRASDRGMGPDLKPVALRIAILQMNIAQIGHSFYHPICETSCSEFKEWETFLGEFREGDSPKDTRTSMCEAWRRSILREALERCRTLKVELLILPEYATRPDTISWLAEELEYRAPETAVLAGTFRHAAGAVALPYAADARPMSLGAVLPLIVPGSALRSKDGPRRNARIYSRLKKYPSTGLSEFIRPEDRPLRSVYEMDGDDQQLPERLRYVRDLICSEVFMAMSPANIYSSVPALLEMYRRFGAPMAASDVVKGVMQDILSIAQATSPAIAHDFAHPRQTIMAVPAATTRPFDHHIFGEAGSKAAGLTTAFANMSGLRQGQSCFIGHYRSRPVEGSHVRGLESPYHGYAPGIWTYNYAGGQPLGPDETALIVADINPIDTNPPRPARQIETQPMALVAHIPFLLGGANDKVGASALDIAGKIMEFVKAIGPRGGGGSACDLTPAELAVAGGIADELSKIDKAAQKSLTFRAKGFRVASMQPSTHPYMPALIDWAYVPVPESGVDIEVPPLLAADLANSGSLKVEDK